MKLLDLGEPTSFLDHVYLGCTQRERKPNATIIEEYQKCSNHEILLHQLRNYLGGRNLTQQQSRGHTIWKDMRRSVLKDIVRWR